MEKTEKVDFGRYTGLLGKYLRSKGVDTDANPTRCFNRAGHSDRCVPPPLQLFDTSYKCHGCGIHGDIYDAVGILEGIADKTAQYAFVERFSGDASGGN